MRCSFCKSKSENVNLSTLRFYCNEDCLESYETYSAWKEKHKGLLSRRQRDIVYAESFEDIIARTGGYPVNAAHRGGGFDFACENTLDAFRKSVECGARLLELDLRLTKEKEIVLMHWATIDETTNGSGYVSDHTLVELKKLDAGIRHPRLKGTGVSIPTLREFLDEFAPIPNILFFFDFKDELTYRMSAKLIQSYNIGNRLIWGSVLTSTNSLILRTRCSHHVPVCNTVISAFQITLGHIFGLLDYYTFEHDLCGFILCAATSAFFTKEMVDEIHKHRKRVVISGYGPEINTEERLRQMIEYGVDFIMCDNAQLLQRLLLEKRREPEEEDSDEQESLFG